MSLIVPMHPAPMGHTQPVPHSGGTQAPRMVAPPLACDCHMHLYDPAMPFAAGPVLRHPEASVAHYRQLQQRLGLQRNVVVQPSSYGTDNRVLLAGLRALGPAARGVAVINTEVTPSALQAYDRAGVVGVRFNLVQAGATAVEMLETVADLVRPWGWHIQLHVPGGDLIGLAPRLLALRVPLVIDHFARIQAPGADPAVLDATVRHMLDAGRVWVKLSAPYIADPVAAHHEALKTRVQRWFQTHPQRLVWGSDWPHVTETDKPDDANLLDFLSDCVSDRGLVQVLADNPAHLYRFDADLSAD